MWSLIKSLGLLALLVLVIIGIGQFGWAIILGTISLVIIACAYIIIRVLVEYPDETE